MEEIAKDVAVMPTMIVNAYLVGDSRSWVLVDAGLPGNAKKIKAAAEERFGAKARPRAIVLTHGHLDHAGSARDLADLWDVKVYAHAWERPYLTGQSTYPPLDFTAPGFFSFFARFMGNNNTVNIGERLADLPRNLSDVGLGDWDLIDTPGHTPGHVSLFRRSDRTLLAGDALTTVNLQNLVHMITQRPQVSRPPTPATSDWQKARASVQALSELRPKLIAAGHGKPIADATEQLKELALNFPMPEHGRYLRQPAGADETGVTYLPPKPPDKLMRVTAGIAAGVSIAAIGALLLRQKR